MTRCPHNCAAGWITTTDDGRVMPCPRHLLTTHQEWAAGKYESWWSDGGAALPSKPPAAPTAAGLAASRQALPQRKDLDQ
jgi:hypothetical protein